MFRINKNKIRITKGDDAIFKVNVFNNKQPYDLSQAELVMTVRKTAESNTPLFNIQAEDGYFKILHDLTTNADCGTYVYDIQLTDENGYISTLVKNYFEITEEVTR